MGGSFTTFLPDDAHWGLFESFLERMSWMLVWAVMKVWSDHSCTTSTLFSSSRTAPPCSCCCCITCWAWSNCLTLEMGVLGNDPTPDLSQSRNRIVTSWPCTSGLATRRLPRPTRRLSWLPGHQQDRLTSFLLLARLTSIVWCTLFRLLSLSAERSCHLGSTGSTLPQSREQWLCDSFRFKGFWVRDYRNVRELFPH